MSDIFDHEMDAYDQAEAMGWDEVEALDTRNYRTIDVEYLDGTTRKVNIFSPLKLQQRPDSEKMYGIEVSMVHRETEKAYQISGEVDFEGDQIEGLKSFQFARMWFPKSRCDFNGNAVRAPRWLIRRKVQQQFGELDE